MFGSLQSLRNLPRESPSDPLWAIGVIDLVEFGGTPPRPAIVDTKTRTVPSMPGFAQKRSSRLQVAIYKVLFDGLTSHDAVAWAPSMLAWHDVDPSTRQFSHDVADQLQRRDLQGCSLLEVMQVALQMFRALGPSGEELKVGGLIFCSFSYLIDLFRSCMNTRAIAACSAKIIGGSIRTMSYVARET